MQVLENKKKTLVTGITKRLNHDIKYQVTNILYHGEFKMQIHKDEFDKENTIKERRIIHDMYGYMLSSYEVSI